MSPVEQARRRAPAKEIGVSFAAVALMLMMGGSLAAGLHAQATSQSGAKANDKPRPSSNADPQMVSGDARDPASAMFWIGGRYRLTASDVIEVRFPYVPEFDQILTVQPDGYVSLRTAGDLRVQGRTLPEFKQMLLEAYADILREPVINIVLKEFEKPYFIAAGEVAKPGKYELRGATTLTQGMVLAGGQTKAAKISQVLIYRRFSNEWLEVKEIDVKKMFASRDLSEDPLLRPGDTILVPKSTFSKIEPFIPKPSIGWYIPIF